MTTFPPPNSGQWNTGIFGCFEEIESCCWGFFLPCVLVGRYIEILDQGITSCCAGGTAYCCIQGWTGCGALYTCGYRKRLRMKFGLPESPCADCLTDWFCHPCAICQVYRELKLRGIDPAYGYDAVRQYYEAPPPQAPGQQFMAK